MSITVTFLVSIEKNELRNVFEFEMQILTEEEAVLSFVHNKCVRQCDDSCVIISSINFFDTFACSRISCCMNCSCDE